MTLAAFLLALQVATPAAGHPTIATRLAHPPKLTVGDRFDVTCVIRSRHPSLVTGPLVDSLGTFVVEQEKRRTVRRGDDDEVTYRLAVAGFRTGRQVVPRFAFLVSAGTSADTLLSDTLGVTIASVLPPDMKDIHGLKPAEAFPDPWLWILPVLAVLLAAAALVGRRLYTALRERAAAAAPLLPPWDEALEALEKLPWREWMAAGEAKRFYYALSEILKRYMGRRFEFDAVEQTTTEILATMRARKLPMRDDIGRFFARSDSVKYAKRLPPAAESEEALEQVRAFVLQTRPVESEPDGAQAAAEPARAGGAS